MAARACGRSSSGATAKFVWPPEAAVSSAVLAASVPTNPVVVRRVTAMLAKAGLIGATKALAVELASRRITVNCVAPGLIDTDMTRGLDAKALLAAVPAGRMGTPEEVAAAVSFLMSPDASYVTRQVIAVNGGLIG